MTTTDLCDFCGEMAHHGACAALLAYTERVTAIVRPPAPVCSTCGATMRPAGVRAWLCPNQRDQGNGVSLVLRAKVKALTAERVEYAPF